MKRGIFSVVFLIMFFVCLFSASLSSTVPMLQSSPTIDDDWYFLPAYSNYAPHGLPDFDQQQDNWKARQGIWRLIGGLWSFCGPVALADIFWWFDSRHEDSLGYPGDGVDTYPLVCLYSTSASPTPGPYADDHNYNNVNDLETPWRQGYGEKEFVETIAWYCNTNFCRYPFIRGFAGTYAQYLEEGARQWILDAGLQDHYVIEAVRQHDFSLIVEKLRNNSGIILNFLFYNPKAIVFETFLGHYVAIAGIQSNGSIAVSDPYQNTANPTPTPYEHNDANIVSYDVYPVNFTSPFPEKASWWIEEYFHIGGWTFGGIATYALIISEVE